MNRKVIWRIAFIVIFCLTRIYIITVLNVQHVEEEYYAVTFADSNTNTTSVSTSTEKGDKIASQHVHDHFHRHHSPIFAPPNETVLALISPPGLMSGYRNQIMRFLAFVTYAVANNINYILLNSIVHIGQDQVSRATEILPFTAIFDIDHWNSFHEKLPQLVDYDESSNFTCWTMGGGGNNNDEELQRFLDERPHLTGSRKDLIRQGNFPSLLNASRAIFAGEHPFDLGKARRWSWRITIEAKECKGNPIPYGGGLKANKLWADVQRYTDTAKKNNGTWPHVDLATFHSAIRPNKKWRDVIKTCINNNNGSSEMESMKKTKSLGLHLRVELDMLGHICGQNTEHNATKIFSDIDDFLHKYHRRDSVTTSVTGGEQDIISVISIATYRAKMEETDSATYQSNKAIADENLMMLNHLTRSGRNTHRFGGQDVSVVECGKEHVDRYLNNHQDEKQYNYGSLLPQVLDFEMMVDSDLFIGVRGSTFSTDVWLTRYYQGKGLNNFEYTKNDGIIPISNGGLPELFDCFNN